MDAPTKRHFFHHGGQDPTVSDNSKEVLECHFCQLRSFEKHALYPISVVNETNDKEGLPVNFRFISENQLGKGVSRAEASFRSGCDCAEPADCMYGDCQCLAELDDEDDDEDEETSDDDDDDINDIGGRYDDTGRWHPDERAPPKKKMFAYYSSGERAGLLRNSHLQSRRPIYECHDACGCGPDCPNRVVERGRTIPLTIFRTDDGRGWGVRSTIDIKCGQFVDTYVGEVITSHEADRRRARVSVAQRKDVYLFALDKFSDEDSADERLRAPPFEVDGQYMSGPSRFVNHKCEPNMRIFARVGDHADKNLHDLALFATRDIPKGEELTFDYVDGLETMGADARDPSQHGLMTRCLCGAGKCRGWLW